MHYKMGLKRLKGLSIAMAVALLSTGISTNTAYGNQTDMPQPQSQPEFKYFQDSQRMPVIFPSALSLEIQQPHLIIDNQYGVLKAHSTYKFRHESEALKGVPVFAAASGQVLTHSRANADSVKIEIKALDGKRYLYNSILSNSRAFNDYKSVLKGEIIGRVGHDILNMTIANSKGYINLSHYKRVNTSKIVMANIDRDDPCIPMDYNNPICRNAMRHMESSSPLPPTIPGYVPPPGSGNPDPEFMDVDPDAAADAISSNDDTFCPDYNEVAMAERQQQNLELREDLRRQTVGTMVNTLSASCFDFYQANIFGPIADNFSNGGGFFNNALGSLTGSLGVSIPPGAVAAGGDMLSGAVNNAIQGFVCDGFQNIVDQAFVSGSQQLDAMFNNALSSMPWGDQLSQQIGQPPSHYMRAARVGRFFDRDSAGNVLDQGDATDTTTPSGDGGFGINFDIDFSDWF